MKLNTLYFAAIVAFLTVASSARADVIQVDVFAAANSTSGGGSGGTTSVFLTTGDFFTVTASTDDLWSAGVLPRWSNADGIVDNLFATGSDESGEAAGTLIGGDFFGLWNQHGLSLPFGSLVGSIDGNYFLIGTDFAGNASGTGELLLWYWDSNNFDNTEDILVTITTTVPEPGTLALLGLGLAGMGLTRRRKKT